MARRAKVYSNRNPGMTAYHTQALKAMQAGANTTTKVARMLLLSPRLTWALLEDLRAAGFLKANSRTK